MDKTEFSTAKAEAYADTSPVGDVSAELLSGDDDKSQEEYRLLGQPPLQSHLSFVRDHVVGGEDVVAAREADAWRIANDYYGELEDSEEGEADRIEIRDLPSKIKRLCKVAKQDPRYEFTFDTFPTEFAMVELDRLIIFQTHVTKPFSERLQAQIGPNPNLETLFKFCLPSEGPAAPVDVKRVGSRRFVFSSTSTDFRRHAPVLLDPDQVINHKTFGPVSGFVGLGVGYGSNYFTGIRYGDRILLHNGYHRAHALRASGVTHAPMIIQTVTRKDELEVAAKQDVVDDWRFYFTAARPPLFRDFFNPRICRTYEVHKTMKMIEVTFEIRDFYVRA